MAKKNESTYKWKVDITDLEANMQKANKAIKLANSEFKLASAGMDGWSKSSDGLEAKLEQLNKIFDSENKKLESLEAQYKIVAKEMGESSTAAQDLEIRINNQKATVAKTERQIQTYSSQLGDMRSNSEDAKTALGQLSTEIQNQEQEMSELKNTYQKTALEQGKESDAAKELETKINSLSNELKENKEKLQEAAYSGEELGDSLKEAGEDAKESEGGFTVLKGALAGLLAEGLKAVATGLKDLATEADGANKSFQAMTGTTTQDMEAYSDVMKELYKNNYGESLDDVARAMGEVKQQTNEVDPTKLKDLTKNGIALRDTFDFDIKDSMRSVNMLMQKFGITGEEAFNLISQGAQNGLDKNGDLLDTINEYAVHYEQLGYTSEEFFNSLTNGTATGTFSVDKLGDAVKEFGIRTKDTTATTTEGFGLIGLNADTMREKFAKGGESAKEATDITLKALFEMDDQVKQNQAGVDLFGTMWEDLGIEGVKALSDVSGTASTTKGTMEEINKVKYSDIGSQISGLGRTIKTDFLLPMAEKVIPILGKFIEGLKDNDGIKKFGEAIKFVKDNSDVLVPIVVGLTTAVVGYKISTIAATAATTGTIEATGLAKVAVMTYRTITDLLTGSITAQTIAQKLLNIAQAAAPWAIAAGLIAGVTIAVLKLTESTREEMKAAEERREASADELNSWNEIAQARSEATQSAVSEIDYVGRLRDELGTLVDTNGKVKEGYEGRVKYILGELNEAAGTEIQLVDGVIDKYQEQMQTLDQLMAKKRAKIIIDAGEAAYTEAIQNQVKAINDLQDAEKDRNTKKQEYDALVAQSEQRGLENLDAITISKMLTMKKELDKYEETYNSRKQIVEGYTDTIAQQEYMQKLYANGTAEDIAKINDYIAKSYDDKGKKVVLSTAEQIENESKLLEYLKERHKTTNDEMYVDQISSSENRLKKLQDALVAQTSTVDEHSEEYMTAWNRYTQAGLDGVYGKATSFDTVGQLLVQQLATGVDTASVSGVDAVQKVGDKMVATINGQDYLFNEAGGFLGSTTALGITTGLENGEPYMLSKTKRLKDGVLEVYKHGEWQAAGENAVYKISAGQEINGEVVKSKMRILADGTVQVWEDKNWQSLGKAATDGTKLGIDVGSGAVVTSFGNVAANALSAFKRIFKINSPSRVMTDMGLNVDKSFADSVHKNSVLPEKAMESMGKQTIQKIRKITAGVNDAVMEANGRLDGSVNATINKNVTYESKGSPNSTTAQQTINFNQTIQSPKALTRAEIYRQTNNLLFSAKRGLKNV